MKTTALQIKFILKVYVLRGVVSPDNALYSFLVFFCFLNFFSVKKIYVFKKQRFSYVKYIANGNLLYDSGNSNRSSVAT